MEWHESKMCRAAAVFTWLWQMLHLRKASLQMGQAYARRTAKLIWRGNRARAGDRPGHQRDQLHGHVWSQKQVNLNVIQLNYDLILFIMLYYTIF